MRARVVRPPKDTVTFTAPARANHCSAGGVLLRGATGGNGVVVWLRTPDSVRGGPWPLLQRADTVSPRGGTVGVRFMIGDVAYGSTLDSGTVVVARAGGAPSVEVSGTALQGAAGRVALVATFDSVPLGPDTVSCKAQP